MRITILKEVSTDENRVAATPDSVKKLVQAGFEVVLEQGAGESASFSDANYKAAGATLAKDAVTALKNANLVLKVQPPFHAEDGLDDYPKGITLVSHLSPFAFEEEIRDLATRQINAFSLELIPRITRAQSMDVLSSQSNLAGYRAVIEAVSTSQKVLPMMMTAAGTVKPAKVLILGAGVAGLQAIATAKRLGAIVSAFDVRPAVKEQVQSLGATFIEVAAPAEATNAAETSGGYAKEMDGDYKKRQNAKIAEVIQEQDIVITTALIPGKPAPILITREMVQSMKTGSVIVDMAAIAGGNCELTQKGKKITKEGVTILGYENLPSHAARDASQLYANNLVQFILHIIRKDESGKLALVLDSDDEITKQTLLVYKGKLMHKLVADKPIISGEKKPRTTQNATPKKTVAKKSPPHVHKKKATSKVSHAEWKAS